MISASYFWCLWVDLDQLTPLSCNGTSTHLTHCPQTRRKTSADNESTHCCLSASATSLFMSSRDAQGSEHSTKTVQFFLFIWYANGTKLDSAAQEAIRRFLVKEQAHRETARDAFRNKRLVKVFRSKRTEHHLHVHFKRFRA